MRVYVAGPMRSSGYLVDNIRVALVVAEGLVEAGHIPHVPHLQAFWDFMNPHDYEYWLRLDLKWLEYCDAIVRLPGISLGADREMARAKELGLQILPCGKFLDREKEKDHNG